MKKAGLYVLHMERNVKTVRARATGHSHLSQRLTFKVCALFSCRTLLTFPFSTVQQTTAA